MSVFIAVVERAARIDETEAENLNVSLINVASRIAAVQPLSDFPGDGKFSWNRFAATERDAARNWNFN